MAFTRSNLRKLLFGIDGNTFWYYNTPDSSADVESVGYFNNTQDLLKERDPIWVNSSDGKFIATIESVNSREAQTSISVGGFFDGLGGGVSFPTAAFSWDAENAETPPSSLSFTRASTATVLGTTDGTTNWYQTAKSGEIRYEGLRRVQNFVSDEDLTVSSSTGSNTTITAAGTNDRGNPAFRLQMTNSGSGSFLSSNVGGTVGHSTCIRIRARQRSGSSDSTFRFLFSGSAQGPEITVGPDWEDYSYIHTPAASGLYGIDNKSGELLDIEISEMSISLVQEGQTAPDPYVNPNTTYNANVPGVRYFNTPNGNSVDGNGVVTEAAGSEITGGGYLAEPAVTNQFLTSDVSTWFVSGVTVSSDGINSLGLEQYTIDAGTASERHRIFTTANVGSAGLMYAIMKQGTGRYVSLRRGGNSTTNYAIFDLTDGSVTETSGEISSGASGSISLGEGWFLCWVQATDTLEQCHIGIVNGPTPGDSRISFTGSNETVLIAHTQYESNDFPTSPIVTSGSTVTRSLDDLSTSGVGLGSSYTHFVDVTWPSILVDGTAILCRKNSTSNRLDLQAGNALRGNYFSDGVDLQSSPFPTANSRAKTGMRISENDAALKYEGRTFVVDTSTSVPNAGDDTDIGHSSQGHFRGRIHKYTNYDVGLTDEQLETLVE